MRPGSTGTGKPRIANIINAPPNATVANDARQKVDVFSSISENTLIMPGRTKDKATA